jgi:hypothetical protein
MKIFSFTIVEFLLREHIYNWCYFKASSFASPQYMICGLLVLIHLKAFYSLLLMFVHSFIYTHTLKSARTKKKRSAPLGSILYMYVYVWYIYVQYVCMIDSGSSIWVVKKRTSFLTSFVFISLFLSISDGNV